MAGQTEKLIRNVENQLHLLKVAFTNYSEDVRIALKTPEFDCGVSMAALRKREGATGEARAKKIEAEAERIWKHNDPLISGATKRVKDELKVLSDYVDKKKSASRLPWNSKTVTKASSFIKGSKDLLDGIPGKMTKLKKEMGEVAASVKSVAESINRIDQQAAEFQTEAKGQSDD